MSQALHPLAERYLDALYELPDALRARKDLEDALAAELTAGQHLAIRGFWRIGKTTLLKGVLQRACERTGGAAFVLDLRDPAHEDGLPRSVAEVRGRLVAKVNDFLARVGATELKADPARPLEVLGELAAPLFLGFDELIALHGLGREGMAEILETLLGTPRNVKVAVVCHRHRDVDEAFTELVLNRPGVVSVMVQPLSDEELAHLVTTPAAELGVTFAPDALAALGNLCGNRPWEALTVAYRAAASLPEGFTGALTMDRVEGLMDLDVLASEEEGQAVVETYLRILVTAMTPEERTVLELLALGKEGEATEDALMQLEEAGWISSSEEGTAITSLLMEGIVHGVADGAIRVSVEGP